MHLSHLSQHFQLRLVVNAGVFNELFHLFLHIDLIYFETWFHQLQWVKESWCITHELHLVNDVELAHCNLKALVLVDKEVLIVSEPLSCVKEAVNLAICVLGDESKENSFQTEQVAHELLAHRCFYFFPAAGTKLHEIEFFSAQE